MPKPFAPELSVVQKDRLVQQAKLTAAAYETLLIARALQAPYAELRRAEANYNADINYFDQLFSHRALLAGDLVRVLEKSSFKGKEVIIREWSWANDTRLQLDWPDGNPCRNEDGEICFPLVSEVELVREGNVPRETKES